MDSNKNILVISFYTNLPGSCQAEWVDDRIKELISSGYHVTLISSSGVFTHSDKNIRHIKIPCISPHGANSEYKEIKSRGIKIGFLLNTYYQILSFFDKLLKLLGLRTGEGRWNWAIMGMISIFHKHKKYSFIYSTGGPASVHVLGILYSKLFSTRLLLELQDPLTGDDIGRNNLSKFGLSIFEKIFIKNSHKTIYCTENASNFSKKAHPKFADKICHIYPGSYFTNRHQITAPNNEKIRFTYLGSLYATRNVTKLIQAIKMLYQTDPNYLDKFKIDLYGNIEKKILNEIINFQFDVFNIYGLVPREKALEEALNSDILLLIQNTDNRSMNTIPFKTYDYLRSGKLIFGLTHKNNEINLILENHNHIVSKGNDSKDIFIKLKHIIDNLDDLKCDIIDSELTPKKAVEKMLELI